MKDLFELYADFFNKSVKLEKPVKIIADVSNGITGKIFEKIKISGLEIKIINGRPDGDFPAHGPNPLAEGALNDLKSAIIKEKADFGVVLDGDADRVIFCDDRAQSVETDVIMRLLIAFLKPKKIILDPRNGYLIKNYCASTEIEMIEAKVGRYFIQKMMSDEKADLAAETAGHYHFLFKINGENYHFDSAMRAITEVASAVSKLPYSLSDFIDLLPKYFRLKETNFSVPSKEGAIKKIGDHFRTEAKRISRLDGITMEFSENGKKWWFNIRPSANDPVIRLNMEAEYPDDLKKGFKTIRQIIAGLK